VILVDTSAWVAFLRRTGTPACHRVHALLSSSDPIATTEVIVMEVLAGARDEMHLQQLRRLMLRCDLLPLHGLTDYEAAAGLYRTCRRVGETIRKLVDCLIAIPAIRTGAAVLHEDRDFDAIARHSSLQIARMM
jgi:predicted nucleic acid-binding protein